MKFKIFASFVALFALVFAFVPTMRDHTNAAEGTQTCVGSTYPAFNVFPVYYGNGASGVCEDFPVVQGKKIGGYYPSSASDHVAGLNAQAGDEIQVTVFYHNGSPDYDANVMRNAKATISTDVNSGTSHEVRVALSADNASTKSGVWKINTPSGYKLSVVPNSGRKVVTNAYTGINVLESGLNLGNGTYSIGNLRGCFEYSAFLTYIVKVVQDTNNDTPTTKDHLRIDKTVRNVTAGGDFADLVNAKVGETVEYKIKVYSTGDTINNVKVVDNFPSNYLSYIANTLQVDGQGGYSGISTNGITLSGINTTGKVITFRSTVSNTTNGTTITNTAVASATNYVTVQDSARVYVETTPTNQNTSLSITKEVRNLSDNTSYQNSVSVDNGEQVEYRIKVRNTGSYTATNVRVTDNAYNASGLTQNGNINASRSYTGSFSSSLAFGDLSSGGEIEITYRATINKENFSLTNTATAYADNASTVNDTAYIEVIGAKPNLAINKQVRKYNSGNNFSKTTYVYDGDEVEYQIIVSATSGRVDNVRLQENNINNFTLTTGSGRLDGSYVNDSFYGGTINLGSISAGSQRTFTFRGVVRGSSSIVNTAVAYGDNVSSVQDSATVYFNAANRSIAVNKVVKNVTQGTGYQNSVNATRGDVVAFDITLSNNGNASVENVRFTDTWTSGLVLRNNFQIDSVTYGSNYISGNTFTAQLGSMAVGTQKRVYVEYTVDAVSGNLLNTATLRGDNVSEVRDDASVYVAGGSNTLSYYKSAYNDNKGRDATSINAERGDVITWKLNVRNESSSTRSGFVIEDDLSGVLPLADMVDLGGGTLNGNTIRFPAIDILPNQTITKTFKVRVKESLAPALTFTMINTYGNTVRVPIVTPGVQGPIEAPKTGVDGLTAAMFGLISVGSVIAFRRRQDLLKLIFS